MQQRLPYTTEVNSLTPEEFQMFLLPVIEDECGRLRIQKTPVNEVALLQLGELRFWYKEAERKDATSEFDDGIQLAELYIASQGLNILSSTLVYDRISSAPLMTKIGFNHRMRYSHYLARANYNASDFSPLTQRMKTLHWC